MWPPTWQRWSQQERISFPRGSVWQRLFVQPKLGSFAPRRRCWCQPAPAFSTQAAGTKSALRDWRRAGAARNCGSARRCRHPCVCPRVADHLGDVVWRRRYHVAHRLEATRFGSDCQQQQHGDEPVPQPTDSSGCVCWRSLASAFKTASANKGCPHAELHRLSCSRSPIRRSDENRRLRSEPQRCRGCDGRASPVVV